MSKKIKITLFLILVFVFWRLFLPYPLVSTDFHYVFTENMKIGFDLPKIIWERSSDGLGGYSVILLWAWPLDFLYSFGGFLNIDFIWLEKILGLLPIIILSVWSINRLFEYYGIKNRARLVGILFYLLNTYFLLLIDGGQIGVALAYSILPAVYIEFKRAVGDFRLKNNLFFSLLLLLLSFFDIRIIYFLLLLILVDFIISLQKSLKSNFELFKKYIMIGLFSGLILIGIHFYWILPSILAKPPSLPLNYDNPNQINFLSFATVGHAITVVAPHWPENIFGKLNPLRIEFVFLPMLIFITPLIRRRDRNLVYWFIIGAIGIFLTKGANPPFATVYSWLFSYIPGFSLFRDPTKFYFLIVLSYSIILGSLCQSILQRINRLWSGIFVGLFVVYLLLIINPIFFGKMHGMFAIPNYSKEYFALADKFRADTDYGRVLWIPYQSSLGYSSANHPTLEALRLIEKRPFAVGTVGTYETLNFLRETPFMGEILDITGVKYIVYPYLDPNFRQISFDDSKYYYNFSKQIAKQPWVASVDYTSVPFFVTKNHQKKIFITKNTWWIVGSDDIYNEATASAELSLSKNAMIFAEESFLGKELETFPNVKIVLNKKTLTDLTASFLEPKDILFPAQKLSPSPEKHGWWMRSTSDLIAWKSFLKEKYNIQNQDFDYNGGWAVNEQNGSLEINDKKIISNKLLFVRALESSRGGELKFYQGDELIGLVKTTSSDANVLWHKVGRLAFDNKIKVVSIGDLNVVNALAIVKEDEWQKLVDKTTDIEKSGRLTQYAPSIPVNLPDVTYQQIDSTKYKVKISGLVHPSMLVFSENFDPFWRLDSKPPIRVYSILNGFLIEKDGEYTLEYSPQRYVYWGLWVSSVSLGLLIGTIVVLKSKESKYN